ncbi:hypothetical protein J2T15_003252 [Paenibacillus harenae]|uniref:Glyoxalase/fosfomycin resistance/dioxygenase domain-containing protein n=2 Tax=Paenibacillus harenae TaxID=306543 RepID=A0ABT9U2E9_PAEHA|nr:hypothetical protein [Paenibacillus harenae]
MTDRTGFTLVLQSNSKKVYTYPKDFHLGFYVETKSDVDQFYTKLVEANIPTENEPGIVRNGYTLYFTALGGILFEVTCFSL